MNNKLSILAILGMLIVSILTFSGSSIATTTDFVGVISSAKLNAYYQGFSEEYDNYRLSNEDIELINSMKTPIVIKALFGTWCHDSVREIPRLSKLLDQANNDHITSTFIGVDRDKTAEGVFKLKYTPTVIIYQNNHEIGRIVESPKVSFAQDIMNFVSAK